ncbi:MAG: G1 family glutamic endopeptidase [Candidatus Babeliales bacterium]|jgi:hypothetical protein
MKTRLFIKTIALLPVLWSTHFITAADTSTANNSIAGIIEADRLVTGIPAADISALSIPKGYKQIECHLTPISSILPHQTPTNLPVAFQPSKDITPTLKYSYGWSGCVAATDWNEPALNSVSAIAGTWTVPAIQPSVNDSYCVMWVGMDGFYYRSKTVEQIGTGHCWLKGKEFHYAWFQMFPDTPSNMINDFPLKVGDVITATVNYTSNNIFLMRLYNTTQKVVVTIPGKYTTSSKAKRQSAEWIVEAPSSYTALLPLANFATIRFANCKTTINDVSGYLTNAAWLTAAIKLIDGGGTAKAIPAILPGSSFTVTWQRQ